MINIICFPKKDDADKIIKITIIIIIIIIIIIMTGVAIAGERNVINKETENILKYKDLTIEIECM
jgi:hypothetical protein